MAEAMINQKILTWAFDRSEMPLDVVAKKVPVKADRLVDWLYGDERPSFRQAQSLSAALQIPFGYLFLKEPPEESLPIPDLRTVGSDPARKLDSSFRNLLSDIMFKQDWFRDFMREHGDRKLPFVGRFALESDTGKIVADMRATLYGDSGEPETSNWEKHLRMLMSKAEAVGIWVMRSSVVGSNTHRPLSVSQFRGFAIADPSVPLIFINGKDALAAQIFTLAHELAHIWLGESGISNVFLGESDFGTHRRLEKKCNEVAAEFLVPAARLRTEWNATSGTSGNADRLSRLFKVSRIVIARRAFDLGLLSEAEYRRFYGLESASWTADEKESDGGSFYNTMPMRNGATFTKAVVGQAMSGRLLLKHAASLLNTQPSSIINFHARGRAQQ